MSSIILELQKDSLDGNIPVTQLLRKALVVAKKLKVDEFIEWMSYELNGYEAILQLPHYRKVGGQVMVHNPFHGWQPVIFSSSEEAKIMSSKNVFSPLNEVENLCEKKSEHSVIAVALPDGMTKKLMKSTVGLVPYFIANESQMNGIIEAVRNIILKWSLELEEAGIMGEDIKFSESDKQKVASTIYNIANFTGVIGNISESSLQIGDYNSIHSSLKELGISQEERNELEQIMDSYKVANDVEKKSLFSKGMDWLRKMVQ